MDLFDEMMKPYQCIWPLASNTSQSPNPDVQVWLESIDHFSSEIDLLWSLLSPDEIQRANKFRFIADRNRYVIAHAVLRWIIGKEVGVAPDQLHFERTHDKKPFLAGEFGSGLQFNLSHSGKFVLIAVSHGRQVGVDIEQVQPISEIDLMIEQYFSFGEKTEIKKAHQEERLNKFFEYWTKKEAFSKAVGIGLSLSLNSLDFSGVSDETEFRFLDGSSRVSSWTFYDLPLVDGYETSLVVEGRNSQISCWQLTESNFQFFY